MKQNDYIIILYLFLSFFLFSFFSSESSYMAQNIIVPYIKYSPVYIHLALTFLIVFFIAYLTMNRKFSIDLISILLFVRIGTSIIPAVYIDAAGNTLGRVTIPLITFLAYSIGRQYKGSIDAIINANAVFALILAIQTIYTVQHMIVPNIIYYEQYVKIPLASSNLIAAFITPCIFLILLGYKRKYFVKLLLILALFAAVVLSTSKGAFLVLTATVLIYYIFMNKKIDVRLKFITVIILIMSVILLYAFVNKSLSDFTHQRSDLVLNDIKLWSENIIIGNGMVYDGRGSGSHNIIIDLLVQNGVIGFVLYMIPLVLIFKQLFKNKSRNSLCFGMFLLATFLYSLIETSYFSYSNDMIFWFMSGVAISLSQFESDKIEIVTENQIIENHRASEFILEENE